jgi:hypothetical protein
MHVCMYVCQYMLQNQGRLDTANMHVRSYGQGIKLPMEHLDILLNQQEAQAIVLYSLHPKL